MSNTHKSPQPPTSDVTAEQMLYNIALRADVTVLREAHQSIADFAEMVKEAIAEKIIELDEHIDEIDTLDIDNDEEDAL
jgi:hypothetical protein